MTISWFYCKRAVHYFSAMVNPLSASYSKWSNTLKQFGKLSTNCLSVFDHFVRLAHKWLRFMTTFPCPFNLFHATGPFL